MNIVWSHAVDVFKTKGQLWYEWAQKFPIDIYKDILLLHEFTQRIKDISTQYHWQEKIKSIILDWEQVYHVKDYENTEYWPIVEMMIRRMISYNHMKAFFQSILLDTTNITYQTYDELKVYIYGTAEAIWLMMCQIIGTAPPWYSHAQAIWEWLRLIHMILSLTSQSHQYIPQTDFITYKVSESDFTRARLTRRINDQIRSLIKHYIDQHELLCTYGIEWISYLNPSSRAWVLMIMSTYEELVVLIKKHNYNIFHPRFNRTLWWKIIWYLLYCISYLLWKKS